MKHLTPLVTLISGAIGGWLVPGDGLPQQVHASTAPVSVSGDVISVKLDSPRTHSAFPDVAAAAGTLPSDPQSLPAEAYSREIIRLSAEADRLDTVWQIYKAECKVEVAGNHDFSREWFSLWDNTSRAAVDAEHCKEAPLSLVDAAENIRLDLLRARSVAQEAGVGLGTEVGVLKWHTLEWPRPGR